MVKQKIFLSSALGLCLGFCLFYTPCAPAAISVPAGFELSQGDGDPSEEIPAELLTDEKDETSEDAVATITAEGDFLLPTYLLPVEGENADTQTANNEMVEVGTTTTTTTTITTTTTTQDQPVVAAAQANEPANTNAAVSDELAVVNVSEGSAKPAEPQTPRAIGSGYTNRLIAASSQQSENVLTPAPAAPATPATSSAQATPILIPLAALPATPEPDPVVEPHERKVIPSEYADQMLHALGRNEHPGFIMPREIKVSFYKNATDFSGQTLKWIKAFSINALNDPRLIIQVRLSRKNPSIQYKRLSVIKNTLIGSGLSPHQIQIVYTARPSDSLVLRLTDKPEAAQVTIRKSGSGRRIEKRTTKW